MSRDPRPAEPGRLRRLKTEGDGGRLKKEDRGSRRKEKMKKKEGERSAGDDI